MPPDALDQGQTASATPTTPTTPVSDVSLLTQNSSLNPPRPSAPAPAALVTPPEPAAPAAPVAPVAPVTPAVPAAPVLDPSTLIRESVRAALDAHQGVQQQQAAAPARTPEQEAQAFNERFRVVAVTPDLYNSIINNENPAAGAQALNNLLQGVARQAVLMSQAIVEEAATAARQRLSPLEEAHRAAVEQRLTSEFVSRNPDLKDETALVEEITASCKARGITFQTPDEMFKFIADRARGILKQTRNGTLSPAAPTGQAAAPAPAARQMTPTAMGGRNNGQPARPTRPNSAEEVFGKFAI